MSHDVVDVPEVGPIIRVHVEVQAREERPSIMSRRSRWVHIDGAGLSDDEAIVVAAYLAAHRNHGAI